MSGEVFTRGDRRGGERYLACFPAALRRPDGEERPSLIRDLSTSGVLLLARTTKLAIGDAVKLRLYIVDDGRKYRVASGHVVRVEGLAAGEAGPWLRRVAVRFVEPLTVQTEDVETFRQQAQRLGLGSP
ncbi:MAG: PilZ domain-containing protein [Myxococcota bacterium]|nr:PilZ domain-containing protein [Myxococcota bacterium]